MAANDFYWELAELNPDAVVFEEFEDAYLGYATKNGMKPVAIYSYDYIINIVAKSMMEDEEFVKGLVDDNIVDEAEQVATAIDEAISYFDYNIGGLGKGKDNEDAPIFLHVPRLDEREENL